jgi:hypothetical protein
MVVKNGFTSSSFILRSGSKLGLNIVTVLLDKTKKSTSFSCIDWKTSLIEPVGISMYLPAFE